MKPDPRDQPHRKQMRQRILDDHRRIGELSSRIASEGDPARLAEALKSLLPLLQRHFREEEDEIDGLHASILEHAPEHQNELQRLKEEHKRILDRAQLLLSIAEESGDGGEKLRMLGQQLRERLAGHEAKETELFLHSIWTDIGEGD
ncbi:MAG: hypothetical protein Fur0037_19590 [Planctomycetota bacterium]